MTSTTPAATETDDRDYGRAGIPVDPDEVRHHDDVPWDPAREKTAAGFDTIEFAIAQVAAGRAVIVVDDEDRENEGDLIFAAELATPSSWRSPSGTRPGCCACH